MVRIGILGAANIAKKNWVAIHAAGHTVTAVGSRDIGKAKSLIEECAGSVPKEQAAATITPFGSYPEVINCPDVDAVYVPLPTTQREEWVVMAAKAKKHVLCEKPAAPSLDSLRRMTEACSENGVVFMDCVMFTHSRRLQEMLAQINEKKALGTVRRIETSFSFCPEDYEEFAKTDIRVKANMEPAGAMGDLGWYNLRIILHVLQGALPDVVSGYCHEKTSDGVPVELSGTLVFSKLNVTASFFCSFKTAFHSELCVYGTTAHLKCFDFTLPEVNSTNTKYSIYNGTIKGVGTRVDTCVGAQEYLVQESSTFQEQNMFATFGALANGSAGGDQVKYYADLALKTQRIMDSVLLSAMNNNSAYIPLVEQQ